MSTKKLIRRLKNVTNGYSSTEIIVRNSTSNDPWGPTIEEMTEISQLTFDPRHLKDVTKTLLKRLNSHGKDWRHINKSLAIIRYCVTAGSDEFVNWIRKHFYVIKTLSEFKFIDSNGVDQGIAIRKKAIDLSMLLADVQALQRKRLEIHKLRSQMSKPGIVDSPVRTTARSSLDVTVAKPMRHMNSYEPDWDIAEVGDGEETEAEAEAEAEADADADEIYRGLGRSPLLANAEMFESNEVAGTEMPVKLDLGFLNRVKSMRDRARGIRENSEYHPPSGRGVSQSLELPRDFYPRNFTSTQLPIAEAD